MLKNAHFLPQKSACIENSFLILAKLQYISVLTLLKNGCCIDFFFGKTK